MRIQRFASIYDDMITGYNKSIEETNTRIAQQEAERDQLINDYNNQYQNQLNEYQTLQDQQAANIDQWAETQREQQQKQTDYNIGLINQNKEEAAKQTKAEQANAYIDYQKGLNEFGGSSEELASRGVAGTGFAKNQDIAMNITYQNRVASANAALQKANTDYDNQIQQALLSNDANLAQLAYQTMTQKYQLALEGFEYRSNLWNQKLAYETQTRDTYFGRINNYQTLIKNYQDSINAAKKAGQEQKNWEAELAEKKRQYNLNLKEEQRQFNAQMARSYSRGGGRSYSSSSKSSGGSNVKFTNGSGQQIQTNYYSGAINPDTKYGTFGTKDKNGVAYQPNNVGGNKLSSSGMKVSSVFGTGNTGRTGANIDNQTIWKTSNNKYYIWDGSQNSYVDVTSDVKSYDNSGKPKTSGGGRHF